MKEMLLLKCGELVLKGLNRSRFEEKLISNLRRRLKAVGEFKIYSIQSTIYVEPMNEEADMERALEISLKVFGIVAVCRAAVCEKDYNTISKTAKEYLKDTLINAYTFKVDARRSDKRFPMKSPEICREIGGDLLEEYPHLKVNVQNPEIIVMVEIRDEFAFVHANKIPGAGGMPVGINGHAALLLSGGIDSPVAGYMIAKRGVELSCIHFESFPYTSERAMEKVLSLAKIMTAYTGRLNVFIVPFTQIQEEIRKNCPEDLFTLVMRRFMMRIAESLAVREGCKCIVTGESLGQVASQTIEAMDVTGSVCSIPVFRPVIGMDKEEIVVIARKIGTFETSILPYEDCCTVFSPKHPLTRPKRYQAEEAERGLLIQELIETAINKTKQVMIEGKED
ncbi:MAG: tRNA 4-thiouridine(8) synthase ThiI [Clostridiales bacterium]|nr:tRNA 4-thiouridine(8) synthase ThiI [Clostridiales bacterium]